MRDSHRMKHNAVKYSLIPVSVIPHKSPLETVPGSFQRFRTSNTHDREVIMMRLTMGDPPPQNSFMKSPNALIFFRTTT